MEAIPSDKLQTQPDDTTSTSAQEAEETDVWWGSYAARTMLFDSLVCACFTAGIIGAAWYLGAWQGSSALRYATLILLPALWLFQLLRWAYRITAINYRLTSRRLFRERGFRRLDTDAVELTKIGQVVVVRSYLEKLVKVGRIYVFFESDALAPIVLKGVREPEHVAMIIREQIAHARERLK